MRLLWNWPFKAKDPTEEETRLALELAETAEEHAREVERAKEIQARLEILDTQVRSFVRPIRQGWRSR